MTITIRKPDNKLLIQHIGLAINQWNLAVGFMELCIILFMGIKPPGPKGLNSFLRYVSDSQKIDILLTLHHDNPEYHHLISYNDINKKLKDGLDARNYFAHTILIFDSDDRLSERVKPNKKDPKLEIKAIEWEKLAQYQQKIQGAIDFLKNFWYESERIRKK